MPSSLALPKLPIVLVGLMGVGKSTVGKRLAKRLGMEFVDSDSEIELAADHSIAEIFARFGEESFRDGERRVIARLIRGAPKVIATGGLATLFMERTRVFDAVEPDLTIRGLALIYQRLNSTKTTP